MKLEKLTEEYSLAEQEGKYFLNFGIAKHNKPVTVRIRFTDIDSKNFILEPKCGCTVTEKENIDATTVEADIVYNAASIGKFDKTVIIKNGNKRKELKLTGQTTL